MQYNIIQQYSTIQQYSLWAYCVFIQKFATATKNLKTKYTFLVKPTSFFINSRNKKRKFLTLTKLTLTILDKY